MTKMKGILAAISMAATLFATGCSSANSSTKFWVRSNCEMCKETIETALNGTDGVAKASLDLESHVVHVDFDSTKVKVAGLHQAVAKAGYETKEMQADAGAYTALPKCCKKPEDM